MTVLVSGPGASSVYFEPEPEGEDEVAEFDPEEDEVPVEYTMEQDELANREAEQAAAPAEPAADEAGKPAEAADQPIPDNLGAQILAVVPFGESCSFDTEILSDGTARLDTGREDFQTVNFTITMREYLLPADFAARYAGEFRLSGDEAGASFDILMNTDTGAAIAPQKVIDVAFCSASGKTVDRGFQIMDAEISGSFDVSLTPGQAATLYKRYAWSDIGEEMRYMVVSSFVNGEERIVLFDLEGGRPEQEAEAAPETTYASLKKGDRGEEVKALQARLVELKYLDEKPDGIFGKNTEKGVKNAQEAFGMETTGVADNDFQQKLFAEDAPAKAK